MQGKINVYLMFKLIYDSFGSNLKSAKVSDNFVKGTFVSEWRRYVLQRAFVIDEQYLYCENVAKVNKNNRIENRIITVNILFLYNQTPHLWVDIVFMRYVRCEKSDQYCTFTISTISISDWIILKNLINLYVCLGFYNILLTFKVLFARQLQ